MRPEFEKHCVSAFVIGSKHLGVGVGNLENSSEHP